MGPTIQPDEFRLMQEYIEKVCGILVGTDKSYLIESRLGALVVESGCASFREFHQKLHRDNDPNLRDRIVDLMTTNETLWFRDSHPYTILQEALLPDCIRQMAEGKRARVRIWSAASSTGQEPYTIAMQVLEATRSQTRTRPSQFEIPASDISKSALQIARMGRYDRIAINRGLPEALRQRYFDEDGRVWLLKKEVKDMVNLRKFNLQDSFLPLGRFDIIFCRNVAIYFSDEFKKDLFRRIAAALNPGGILFLGASEALTAYSREFEMLEHGHGIYYRLRSAGS